MLPPLLADHFARPRNAGDLPGATHEGRATNPTCGDVLVLRLRVAAGRIEGAAFRAQGCSALLATSSLLTEALIGVTVEEIRSLDPQDLVRDAGGVPRESEHAPALARRALLRAIGPTA
jgi:NifU-like protein involved in Fe-S cluster formation